MRDEMRIDATGPVRAGRGPSAARQLLVVVAVALVACTTPGAPAADQRAPTALGDEYYLVGPSSLEVEVQSCNAGPALDELVESRTEVRIAVDVAAPNDGASACQDSVAVQLDRPLGDRTVVDAVTGTRLRSGDPATTPPGDEPASERPLPTTVEECVGPDVAPEAVDYLTEWTTGVVAIDEGTCILGGRPGPEPAFDTGTFGQHQQVDLRPPDGDAGRLQPPPDAITAAGHPVVYLGVQDAPESTSDAEPLEPEQRFAFWFDGTSLAHDGAGIGGLVPDGSPGGLVGASTGRLVVPLLVVDANTAVVALQIDGRAVAWSRPVAQLAAMQLTRTAVRDATTITLRELDADGVELAVHEAPDLLG